MEAAKVTPVDPNLAAREQVYYRMQTLVVPWTVTLEASSLVELPDGRVAIGTRRGDVFLATGLDEDPPRPKYQLFASGLHEVFGLAEKNGALYATQQCEVTRLVDENGDGRADLFETVSDAWGFGGEHEFTYGSIFDRDGNLWVAHCLTGSYTSKHPFRGWAQRITTDGRSIPTCSGLRSPGGVGINAAGDVFYTENQGPWNGACGLKHLKPQGFMGHPISFPWYDRAPGMGPRPEVPRGGRDYRQHEEAKRVPQLVPPAVVFPYKKMGQSASAIMLDVSQGRFGPFANQLFVGDYTLSLVMRVWLEKVGEVYQGACFPFRQGFATGVIGLAVTRQGHLITGGCSRGWPTRGTKPYSLQRLSWTGKAPLEVQEMRIMPDGFQLLFTRAVDRKVASDPASYRMTTYTYRYQKTYGSPEVDHSKPTITSARLAEDGRTVRLSVDGLRIGHVHELHLDGVRSPDGERLLHPVAYYTLNALPR
ncbi:MAG: hypothetical protein CMJ83_20425 [Planctomycetes bacterium]|nr:hypothetical protein [Planctomycetota bacterium]